MNEHLKQKITKESILSYSSACIEVYEELLNAKREGFQRIVIPSRGAYPFYNGASAASIIMEDSFIFSWYFDTWLLPFTSDWGQADISADSKSVRKFWVKVLADSLRNEKSPYTDFYNKLVDTVGERLTINTTDLKVDKYYKKNTIKGEKFVFIDTSVSGKAICDIIDSFHDFNLNDYLIILISDHFGHTIKSGYRSLIEKEKQKGRLKEIAVESIYSEDASPLLNTGISSIVFPSLIETAYHEIPEFRNNGFVGAGLWFIDSVSHLRDQFPKLNGVRGILSTMNYRGMRKISDDAGDHWFEESISHDVETMIEWLGDFNLLDPSSTKRLIYDRLASQAVKLNEDVDVTGSHIIRIDLPKDIIKDLIKASSHQHS